MHCVRWGPSCPYPNKGRHSTAPLPIFGPYLLRPNGCMEQDVTWYGAKPQPRRLCVRWGPRSALPKLSAHVYCGQTAGWMKLVLGMEVGLSPGDIVLDGDPAPLPTKRVEPSQFSANFYCGQTARWIKMALGMEVGLGPVHIVLDVDTAPLLKKGGRAPPPIFGPSLFWPNSWMHQDATWYGGRPQPRRLCVRWGPSPLHQKGRSPT